MRHFLLLSLLIFSTALPLLADEHSAEPEGTGTRNGRPQAAEAPLTLPSAITLTHEYTEKLKKCESNPGLAAFGELVSELKGSYIILIEKNGKKSADVTESFLSFLRSIKVSSTHKSNEESEALLRVYVQQIKRVLEEKLKKFKSDKNSFESEDARFLEAIEFLENRLGANVSKEQAKAEWDWKAKAISAKADQAIQDLKSLDCTSSSTDESTSGDSSDTKSSPNNTDSNKKSDDNSQQDGKKGENPGANSNGTPPSQSSQPISTGSPLGFLGANKGEEKSSDLEKQLAALKDKLAELQKPEEKSETSPNEKKSSLPFQGLFPQGEGKGEKSSGQGGQQAQAPQTPPSGDKDDKKGEQPKTPPPTDNKDKNAQAPMMPPTPPSNNSPSNPLQGDSNKSTSAEKERPAPSSAPTKDDSSKTLGSTIGAMGLGAGAPMGMMGVTPMAPVGTPGYGAQVQPLGVGYPARASSGSSGKGIAPRTAPPKPLNARAR